MIAAPALVVAVLLVGAGCSGKAEQPASEPELSLRKAARYLWSRQAPDGGWHSSTYGLLKRGQSLTPFVLDALLQVPESVYAPSQQPVDLAIGFLKRHTDSDGGVGRMDPMLPDYPNYATALAVQTLCRARRPGWQQAVAPMVVYLRRQQFTEENGWTRDHPAYGAWGMGGDRRTPPEPGHVDLSMTRYVLQALAAAGVRATDPAFQKARVFLERCQNADGGFIFSTVVLGANKAGGDGAGFRSYGTATADGILALVAIGTSSRDEGFQAAGRWLLEHHQPSGAPGFVGKPYQRWTQGLRFYYAAASTEVFRGWHMAQSRLVADSLLQSQRADGSWVNPENLVKEDEPLIATGFAVRALVNAGGGAR